MKNENCTQNIFNELISSFYAPIYVTQSHNVNQNFIHKNNSKALIKYTRTALSHKTIHISNTSIYIKNCFSLSDNVYI